MTFATRQIFRITLRLGKTVNPRPQRPFGHLAIRDVLSALHFESMGENSAFDFFDPVIRAALLMPVKAWNCGNFL